MTDNGKTTELSLGNARLFTRGDDVLDRLELGGSRAVTLERIGDQFLLTIRPPSLPDMVIAVAFRANGKVMKAHCDILGRGLSKETLLAALTEIPSPHVSARVTSDCHAKEFEWQPSCHYGEAEVRLKKDTSIFDEVVFDEEGKCLLHVEQMDKGNYWIGVYPTGANDVRLVINLVAKGGKVVGLFDVE
jgi:hypothetical protein